MSFKKNDDDLTVELSRKNEYREPTFSGNREELQEGHEYKEGTPHGRFVTDSKDKDDSAIRYEESIYSPTKKLYNNLQSLKNSVDNKTLFEVLPEDRQIQRKILSELKTAQENLKNESDSESVVLYEDIFKEHDQDSQEDDSESDENSEK